MRAFRLLPEKTTISFMKPRFICFIVSGILMLLSAVAVVVPGLNFGIDFQGGIMLEIRTPGPADIGAMRTRLNQLEFGEIQLQSFGAPTDVLIRIPRQEGDEAAQQVAAEAVKAAVNEMVGEGISWRRMEFVGPKVSGELLQDGLLAVTLALVSVMIYIWFRFEWQYGVGAIVALVHDVLLTLGMFAVTGYEVNLSTVAAVLTIVGYSLNDTVVIYDRVRENLRRYKKMPIIELLDRSVNETLGRTILTSFTTLLALIALYVFGGEVLRSFTFAMIWGVVVGTYSTVYIATPILTYLNIRELGAKAALAGAQGEEAGTAG